MHQARIANVYLPHSAVIREVIVENSLIKTFVTQFLDQDVNASFSYQPGQFVMVSIPHHGEAPISISSTPTRPGEMHLSVRVCGHLTTALHELGPGAVIGMRGPYGRPFPLAGLAGKNLLFVAGGIGLAPLRSVINYALDQGEKYGKKTILYGSRRPSDIAFRSDLSVWQERPDVACHLTVDEAQPGWDGHVGVVTTLWEQAEISFRETVALLCGPPVMIKFVLADLRRMGFPDEAVITTMERHMKCGVGICGHCHMDKTLICTDGPVFSAAELAGLHVF